MASKRKDDKKQKLKGQRNIKNKNKQKQAAALKPPPGILGIEVKACDCGRGVFVIKPFEAEEIVGKVAGKVITAKGYSSQNCMDLGKHGVLEPGPPFQFLNHSCQPNCELVWEARKSKKTGRRKPRIYVQAIRDIRPGEQLTLDYAWPAEDAIPCQCESASCRGWVVAEEELHLVPSALAV